MANLIVGGSGANVLSGTADNDVIYGFNPNGSQRTATTITAERVATGLSQPLFAGAPGGDTSRLFIVEKGGVIKILDLASGNVLGTPFLDISNEVHTAGEKGLLGLAFDPDFANNGFFYVNLINLDGDTEVRRYTVSADPNVADEASADLILTFEQRDTNNHKAGWMGFGPDGYLYIASGDGGGGGTPNDSAQDINSLLGKILRVDVSGDDFPVNPDRDYAIPNDNPFVDKPGADEIYALGLRNPFRDSFDRALGTLFIADVGQAMWEEINIGQLGANYGWRVFEGPDRRNGDLTEGKRVDPIYFYSHDVGESVIGGYVYRGGGEALQGQFIFADFVAGTISALRKSGNSWVATDVTNKIDTDFGAINLPSSFGEDGFGNLYVVDIDGDVFRLTPQAASNDLGDILSGGAGDDMLFGGSGDDTLEGGVGADLLNGGPGSDTASYADSAQGVTINLATGAASGGEAEGDLFQSIENIIGSAFGDILTGDDGDNVIAPGAGIDAVDGGGGSDTVSYATSALGVTVDLDAGTGTGGDADGDTLQSIENVIGSAAADVLSGTGGDNLFAPGDGDDTVDGRGGSDTVSYAGTVSSVTVDLDFGTNQATGPDIGTDQLTSIENIIGGFGNDILSGDAGPNILRGGPGADMLDGRDGDDTFQIAGNEGIGDIFIGGADTDTLEVLGGATPRLAGFDALASSIEIWDGNGQGLLGTSAANLFDFSNLDAKTGLAFIEGAAGNDSIIGSDFADVLRGGSGADTLRGGPGNDVLTGGAQRDFLYGDDGSDRFDFNKVSESRPGANRDRIQDFERGEDEIDLRSIDAKTGVSGKQNFKWIGKSDFHDKRGELRYEDKGSKVIVQGDVDGDGKADFEIFVKAGTLGAGDFLL